MYKFAISILVTLCLLFSLQAGAANPNPFNLAYTIKAGKKTLGTLNVEMSRLDNGDYRLHVTTEPGSMAKMLGSEPSQETAVFANTDTGWTLKDFHQVRRGRKAGQTSVQLSGGSYEFLTDGKKKFAVPAASSVEPTTFPIAVFTSSPKQLNGQEVLIVRRLGLRAHQYQDLGLETLELNGVTHETYKWKRVESKKSGPWYTIWTDRTTGNLVKMTRVKDGKSTSLELIH